MKNTELLADAISAKLTQMNMIFKSQGHFNLEVYMLNTFFIDALGEDNGNFFNRCVGTGMMQKVMGFPFFIYAKNDDESVTTPPFRIHVIVEGDEQQ